MAEGKLLASLLDQLQQLCRALIVGKVAPVGLDAGAQVVGIPPAVEHVEVVVAFQRHQVTAAQGLMHRRGQDSQVGGNGHGLIIRGVDAVAHAGHVVAGGEHRHAEISHILFPAGQGAQLTAGGHNAVCIQKIQRIICTVYRQRILFEEGGQPLDVVRVLMGDQNARTIADVQAQLLECRRGGAHALSHINDDVLFPRAHHAAIAGGTRV